MDIDGEFFEIPAVSGCLHQEQKLAKIGAMTATRTKLPFASSPLLARIMLWSKMHPAAVKT